jgi:hypothetical protein
MFLGEILGFWFVVGVAFFGWRRLSNSKCFRVPRAVPYPTGIARSPRKEEEVAAAGDARPANQCCGGLCERS